MQLELLNAKSFLAGGFDTAIGTDGLTSRQLAVKIALVCEKTVVLPPYYLGMSDHYRHQPVCISLTNGARVRVLEDVLSSLMQWGIEKVLILNGHDGNIPCAEFAARTVKVRHKSVSIAVFDWWVILQQMLRKDTFKVWGGWGHAGEVESSIGLALFPELMNMGDGKG
jgi:creatinine amidohydrolase